MKRRSQNKYVWWIGSLLALAAFLLFQPGGTAVHADGAISGTAFRDYNANGVRDTYEPGIGNVAVTAVTDTGDTASTTTAANGAYSLPTLVGSEARVEFTLPTNGSLDFLRPGAAGGTTVQFVNISVGDVGNVSVGFNNPAQYSQEVPTLVSSVFVNGDPLAGGTAGTSNAFVSYPYDNNGFGTPPNTVAIASQIGSVWGTAPHPLSQTVFTAAMMKRHAGFGPLGQGGIYRLTLPATVTPFVDVNTIGINTGPVIARTLGANAATPTHDPAAFDAVGKISIGDMDMSEDEQTLWLVNLFDRTLYSIYIGYSPTVPDAGDVTAYPIPDPGCSNGDYRPWAVDTYDGQIYVGIVCSAETSQLVADLEAHVLAMDADAPGTFTTIFSMPLNFPRGYISTSGALSPGAEWLPWIDQWTDIGPPMPAPGAGPFGQAMYPQPMLTDIEFDIDGSMLLGFTDRFGHQGGNENYSTNPADTATYEGAMGGDLIRVCNDGGTFVLENDSTCPGGSPTNTGAPGQGPGGREYYWQDMYNISPLPDSGTHQETIAGSLAHKFGSNEILTAVFDPSNYQRWRSGGVAWFRNSDGTRPRGYELVGPDAGGQPATFGKVAGIGDVELLVAPAPIEVGNRVWQDDNGNGIQDPGEPPIAGVDVELVDSSGAVIATATTDADGLYYFANVPTTGAVAATINAADNDAEQNAGGTVTVSGTTGNAIDLDLGRITSGGGQNTVGLRFTGLNIPQGATITSAFIQFSADNVLETSTDPVNFRIRGEAADNPGPFTTTAFNITSRTSTTAIANWSPPGWGAAVNASTTGPAQQTTTLAAVVQEIVNRPGWSPGNAMVLILDNDPATTTGYRDAESFDGNAVLGTGSSFNPALPPRLIVNYAFTPANYAPMQYRSDYQLRVNLNQTALNGWSVSPPQADGSASGELRDSDGQARLGGYVAVDFTTGGPGENNHTFDFGFAPVTSLGDFVWDDADNDGYYDGPVQVGDFVWYDLDGDGLQDVGEPGVNGVRAALHRSTDTDCADLPLAQTSTGPDGRYLFDNLAPGNYFVCFTLADLPAGFVVTVAGGDNAADATGRTGNTGPLTAGQQDLTRDMGIVNTAGSVSVGDRVWYDVNGDGRQDTGEPGVPGVTVDLFTVGQDCADTPVSSQTTDENGNYSFTGLADSNYFVCFDLTTVPPGYTPTTANNQADDSVDSDADANGQTPPTGALTAGQFDFTLDMGIVSTSNVSVGDTVWYDDNANGLQDAGEGGVPGVSVELYAAGDVCGTDTPLMVTVTGGDGSYLFSGLPSGAYFVCFDVSTIPGGFEVTGQNVGGDDTIDSDADPTTGATAVTGTIPANGSDLTLDMGVRQTDPGLVSVGDHVWYDDDQDGVQDPDEMGVPGVTAVLHPATDADCTVPSAITDVTDEQGNYLFAAQPPGDYFVCFDLATAPAGFVVTPPDQGGDDGTDSDADPTTGRTANTGALVAGQANTTLDMGIYPDGTEVRLPGVTMQVYAAATVCDGTSYEAEVTTDANGNYLFTDLPAGQYYVHMPASNFAPGGPLEYMFATLFTDPNPDDDLNNDNSAQEVTAGACAGGLSTNLVTLAVSTEPLSDGRTDPNTPDNSHNLTVDNGAFEPLCIGDLVWFDADDDGTVNGAEYGINGIEVQLYLDVDDDGIFEPGGDDGTAVATTTTATVAGQDGSYSFCSIIEGSYFVHIPTTEFDPGDLLYLFGSSTTITDPTTTILENDNNGDDGGDAATNGVTVLTAVSLNRRLEPTTADFDINDNGRRDASTNQTVDLGLTAVLDYGDLPDTYNNTIFGDDGPRHPDTGLYLGAAWDNDNDGQESIATDGDDNDGNDDEDGIVIPTGNGAGTWGDGTAEIDVTVTGGPGCVVGWTDYNLDGDFADEINDGSGGADVPELMFVQFLPTGTTQVVFNTPQSTAGAGTFVYPATLNMRYRIFPVNDPMFTAVGLATDGNGCPTGATVAMASITVEAATGGEVEDYQQDFSPTAVNLQNIQATLGSVPFVLMLFVVMALVFTGLGIALARRHRV